MGINLSRLNARQRDAVLHASGPLLILAGAGSGKTSTMAYRIAHLIAERKVLGSEILGLSFTNKAATELKERVSRLVTESSGRSATRGLVITTFHSLCARFLRAHADKLGFQNNFTIMDQHDQVDVLKQVLRNIKIDERRFDPEVILFQMGQAKNRFLGPEEAQTFFLESGRLAPDYALAAASSFPRYQEQLRLLNAMDFDDLIYYSVKLLETQAEVRDHYNKRFKYLLVDEYQDTNPAQFRILKLLTEKQNNICVVGDDDQSIYAWRGADSTHILQFPNYYPNVKTITLDQNYRSTSRILEAANHVIEKNKNRYPKKLWSDRGTGEPLSEIVVEDDRAESDTVAEEILKRARDQGRPWSDFAILYRSNSQSRVFEEALRRNVIPYKIVGGLSFLERKEVKDVLAYWRLVVNLKDDASLRRILNRPARKIGKTSIDVLGKAAFERGVPFFEVLSEADQLTPKTSLAIRGFRELILGLRQRLELLGNSPQEVAHWAQESLARIEMKKAIEEESDDPVQVARKWENVEELVHSIGQSHPVSQEGAEAQAPLTGLVFLQEFLNRMMLQAQEEERDEDKGKDDREKNQVTLLTFHGAKGLEYPIVFMVGMEEGFLPHRRTLEEVVDLGEERRLCYVGITRAKDYLFLVRAKNRIRYGKPVPRNPSRFLEEIPKDILLRTDLSSTPEFTSKEQREAHETKVKDYLAEIRARLTGKSL